MPIRSAQLAAARCAAESLADQQAGVISAAQARSCGLSEGAVRRLVDRGEWVRLHRGVLEQVNAAVQPDPLHHVGLGQPAGPRLGRR